MKDVVIFNKCMAVTDDLSPDKVERALQYIHQNGAAFGVSLKGFGLRGPLIICFNSEESYIQPTYSLGSKGKNEPDFVGNLIARAYGVMGVEPPDLSQDVLRLRATPF